MHGSFASRWQSLFSFTNKKKPAQPVIAGLFFSHYVPWARATLSRFANRPATRVHALRPADPKAGDFVFVELMDVTIERTG